MLYILAECLVFKYIPVVLVGEVSKNVVTIRVVRSLRVVMTISDVVTPEEGSVVTVVTSGGESGSACGEKC